MTKDAIELRHKTRPDIESSRQNKNIKTTKYVKMRTKDKYQDHE